MQQLIKKLHTLNDLTNKVSDKVIELHREADRYKSIIDDTKKDIQLLLSSFEPEDDYDIGYNAALNGILTRINKRLNNESL